MKGTIGSTYGPVLFAHVAFLTVFLVLGELTTVGGRVVLAVAIVSFAGWSFLTGAVAMDDELRKEREATEVARPKWLRWIPTF